LDNKLLLWHGSRITNFVGILSQGLRIAPPEAPVSGYRFGKGCYFADMSSKSLGYCYPSGNTALILLCEVAVGNPNVVKNSDSSFCLANLPKGKHSTKYLGSTFPPEESYITHENVKIPIGKPSNVNGWDFNEYIVYDTNQVKLKYLLKLKV
jgi:poly [ADP-ribose] polymerase